MKIPQLNLLKLFNLEKTGKAAIIIGALALFVLINSLVAYLPWRADFSQGQAHTLSPATKKILRELDDVVRITFFISSDLPVRLLSLKTDAVDVINEYKRQGRGKIRVKILDPKKDNAALSEAKTSGVPELPFSQIEKDKYAVASIYFGLKVNYGTKQEIIPQAANLASLEYDLTSAIFKLTQKEPLKIGLVGPEGYPNLQEDSLLTMKRVLNQQFEITPVDLSAAVKNKSFDADLKTLVLIDDGKKNYGTDEAGLISNYLEKKGKAIFAVDGLSVVEDTFTAKPAGHNLFPLFEQYGIKLNRNFVLSQSSEMASFSTGLVNFITPYPFWVKTGNFSQKAGEFSQISQLSLPWVSSIDLKKKSGIQTKVLVRSEAKSWAVTEVASLSPQGIEVPQKEQLKTFNLMIEAKTPTGGALLVIPSSRFLQEEFISRSPENLALFINLINNYASGGALAGIRARAVSPAPLADLAEQSKDTVKYLTILLLPGLFAIFGAFRLIKRK